MRERFQELLPAQFQQAGHHQPHFEQGASPFVLVDVDHPSVDIHAASLGGERGQELQSQEKQDWAVPTPTSHPSAEALLPQPLTLGSSQSRNELLLEGPCLILNHISTTSECFTLSFR